MTIPEISQLRANGNVAEALQQCRQILAQSPTDRYARIEMARCLKAAAEQAEASVNAREMIEILQELSTLHLDEIGERALANAFCWHINRLFGQLKNRPADLSAAAGQILDILPNIPFDTNYRYYNYLAEAYTKVHGPQGSAWPRFAEFMDWYGFENLTPDDYKRITLHEPGRTLPSLAERLHSAYAKCLKLQIESGQPDNDRIERFIARLNSLVADGRPFQFSLYQLAQLLTALGRREEASAALRPFVQRMQTEFWVWDALADTVDSPQSRLSCLCRALTCRADPKFLGKLHLKAAVLMHELGFDSNARAEVREMHRVYTENGWRIPAEAYDMRRQDWYQAAVPPESNSDFYRAHLAESEELLYSGMPETPILISHINAERRICNFITADRHQGFFSFRGMRGRFRENQIHMVRLDSQPQPGRISRVLTHRHIEDVTPFVDVFFKRVEGTLRLRPGQNFGFVGDVYADSRLLPPGASDGARLRGTAALAYNPRRGQFAWRAVTLTPADR